MTWMLPGRDAIADVWNSKITALLLAALVARLLAMALVPLVPEEAYYWMYAQHPALSYYDHPPMVAWIIGLGTAIFGDNELGVRIVGNLLMVGASVLMYAFGRMWYGRAVAFLSAALLHVLPLYFGAGFVATMDSALLFYWALGLVGISRALKLGRGDGWYWVGIALGGAMLSKYTGVFIAAGCLLAVVTHRNSRRQLRTAHPWLALLLAAAIFSPVVVWNSQHDWASFRFQFIDRFGDKPLRWDHVGTFATYQLLAVTPLCLWACALKGTRVLAKRRWRLKPRAVLAICFSAPLLAVMAHKSLRYEIHINWTLPLFLSLFPSIVHFWLARLRWLRVRGLRQRWYDAVRPTLAGCLAINLLSVTYLMTLQPLTHWVSAFGPWPTLARIIEDHEELLEKESGREPLIVADGKYRLASVLAFYRKAIEEDADPADFTTSQWILHGNGLGYFYWSLPKAWQGRDGIYVVDGQDDDLLAQTSGHFASVELADDPRLKELSGGRYRIALCRHLLKIGQQPDRLASAVK